MVKQYADTIENAARKALAESYGIDAELVRLPGPALKARFAYYAVHPAHKPPSAAAQAFIDWLKEEARDERTPLPPMPDDFLGRGTRAAP